MFTEDTLRGKSILVTGGGSGLGLAMARQFASVGANIAICGRREEKLREAQASLQEFGTKIVYHSADVRDYDTVGEMVARVTEALGGLDGLVNNAAGNFYAPSEEITPNGFKTVVDIVLHGTFNCTQHVGRYWIANKRPGTIRFTISHAST